MRLWSAITIEIQGTEIRILGNVIMVVSGRDCGVISFADKCFESGHVVHFRQKADSEIASSGI